MLEVNASVGPTFTEFTASGPSALVGDHLERLCQALADPPLDRMPVEAPVVAAEIDGDDGLHQALLAARYGFRDLGSGAVTGPGPDGLRPEQVQAATRWFVAQNAVLVVDGPLPPDLRLPLPSGGPRAHVRVPPRRRTGSAAVVVDAPACMASLLLPPPDSMRLDELAAELVRQRLLDVVRHEKGLTYVVDDTVFVDVLHVDGGSGSDLMVGAEPWSHSWCRPSRPSSAPCSSCWPTGLARRSSTGRVNVCCSRDKAVRPKRTSPSTKPCTKGSA